MSIRTLRTILGSLAAAALTTFGGAAHAGFYGSDFDPVAFLGTAQFFLTPGCESDGVHIQGVGGCTFDLLAGPSVTLNQLDPSNPLHILASTTLNFGSNPGKLPDSNDMLFLAYLNGDLAGVTTLAIGGFSANNPSNNPAFDGLWYLRFLAIPHFSSDDDDERLLSTQSNDSNWSGYDNVLTSVDNSVLLYHNCPIIHDHAVCTNGQLADTATNVSFAPIPAIPEPGTLGLLLGSLGAGWLARRRKVAA